MPGPIEMPSSPRSSACTVCTKHQLLACAPRVVPALGCAQTVLARNGVDVVTVACRARPPMLIASLGARSRG